MDRAVFGSIAIFSGRIPRTNFLDDSPKTRDLSKVIFPNISDSTVKLLFSDMILHSIKVISPMKDATFCEVGSS